MRQNHSLYRGECTYLCSTLNRVTTKLVAKQQGEEHKKVYPKPWLREQVRRRKQR